MASKTVGKTKTSKNKQKSKKFSFLTPRNVLQECNKLLFDCDYLPYSAMLVLCMELLVNLFIIHRVRYTEIDWKAYMQEVEGVINGTLDYSELRGDTGPLVYPAGFVYIFSFLYLITDRGNNILIAQYVYAFLYLFTLYLLYKIYFVSKKVPPYALILCCCISYRVHSIYVLRLFNDPIAICLFYLSLNLFLSGKWTLGSVFYSLAVSVKMNILLYAPALFLSYLVLLGLKRTIQQLSVCAFVQLLLGLPFLLNNPYSYIRQSFDLGRVFFYKWTVNWRFVPEDVFLNHYFHLLLVIVHLSLLCFFSIPMYKYIKSYAALKEIEKDVKPQLQRNEIVNMGSINQLFLLPFFLCNFIGIICSRSLHYQFYVWYYHTLPFLLWSTSFSNKMRLLLLGLIELCWNTYPSTNLSSICLFLCHFTILGNFVKKFKHKIKHNA